MKFFVPLNLFFTCLLSSSLATSTAMAGCSNLNPNVNLTNPDRNYTDNGDGTVTDIHTGLMWQKCSLGLSGADCTTGTQQSVNWFDALAAAMANTDNGYSDWRLPNKNELHSLVEYACSSPAINETFFPSGSIVSNASKRFWTSTPYAGSADSAWIVRFDGGLVRAYTSGAPIRKNDLYFVRLVRGFVQLDETPIAVRVLNLGKTTE